MNTQLDSLALTNMLDTLVAIQFDLKIDLIYLNETIEMKQLLSVAKFFDFLFEYFPGGLVFALEKTATKAKKQQVI